MSTEFQRENEFLVGKRQPQHRDLGSRVERRKGSTPFLPTLTNDTSASLAHFYSGDEEIAEVGVAHRHLDGRVPEELLNLDQRSAPHHQ